MSRSSHASRFATEGSSFESRAGHNTTSRSSLASRWATEGSSTAAGSISGNGGGRGRGGHQRGPPLSAGPIARDRRQEMAPNLPSYEERQLARRQELAAAAADLPLEPVAQSMVSGELPFIFKDSYLLDDTECESAHDLFLQLAMRYPRMITVERDVPLPPLILGTGLQHKTREMLFDGAPLGLSFSPTSYLAGDCLVDF